MIDNSSFFLYLKKYEKDAAGNVTRYEMYVDDVLYSVSESTYDGNGNVLTTRVESVSSITTSLQGILTSREEHSWNEAGVELIKSFDDDGILISTAAITYDEAGNMLTSETYDESGALILRSTYTYDKFEIPVK